MHRTTAVRSWPLLGPAILLSHLLFCGQAEAQPGLKESLLKLDTNKDGEISPEEITPLARPYLERIAESRRISMERGNSVDRWLDAARIYYILKNGISGRDVRPEGENTIQPFGPKRNERLVPEFGIAEIKFPYMLDDVEEARRTMRRYDRNRDGYVDRAEASRNRWTHRNPFLDDLDKDGRLSHMELTQRYARRRLLSGTAGEVFKKARRTGNGVRPGARRYGRGDERGDEERRRQREFSQFWRSGGKGTWLTASMISRFDTNRNGRLDNDEAGNLGLPLATVDLDRNGELTRAELHSYLSSLQEEAGDATSGLPGWFYELDNNKDQQVSMREFATTWTTDKLNQFTSLDSNRDGLLTPAEVLQSKASVGGSYYNETAEVLPPRKTIVSEIEISDDQVIGDLNVQLSITHSNVSFLDAYLTGPKGQRIELFTEVGGGGDHFDKTIFDDQSRQPITKSRPPFRGSFLPEGQLKKQPSLSHFNGKNAKGVWQLVIRGTRSDRFGMLHGWGLLIKPLEGMTGPLPVGSAETTVIQSRTEGNSREEEAAKWKGRVEARQREMAKWIERLKEGDPEAKKFFAKEFKRKESGGKDKFQDKERGNKEKFGRKEKFRDKERGDKERDRGRDDDQERRDKERWRKEKEFGRRDRDDRERRDRERRDRERRDRERRDRERRDRERRDNR